MSDYVVRGFSRSDSGPAVQAGVVVRHQNGFFAGFQGTSVDFPFDRDFPSARDIELQTLLGYGFDLGVAWTVDGQVVSYDYPETEGPVDLSYLEIQATLRYRDQFGLLVSHTDDVFGLDLSDATVAEIYGGLPLSRRWLLFAGVGVTEFSGFAELPSYSYRNAGLGCRFGQFDLRLTYLDSDVIDIPRWGRRVSDHWAGTLTLRF
ncbi:hypothetical protein ABI59_22810 [Acidobacteria bacterium Mor1]|nr:hypothetical protein ABI59_22810 [Acidobacteria bacterium Mor1]